MMCNMYNIMCNMYVFKDPPRTHAHIYTALVCVCV
jgi:hypothetical protein